MFIQYLFCMSAESITFHIGFSCFYKIYKAWTKHATCAVMIFSGTDLYKSHFGITNGL